MSRLQEHSHLNNSRSARDNSEAFVDPEVGILGILPRIVLSQNPVLGRFYSPRYNKKQWRAMDMQRRLIWLCYWNLCSWIGPFSIISQVISSSSTNASSTAYQVILNSCSLITQFEVWTSCLQSSWHGPKSWIKKWGESDCPWHQEGSWLKVASEIPGKTEVTNG